MRGPALRPDELRARIEPLRGGRARAAVLDDSAVRGHGLRQAAGGRRPRAASGRTTTAPGSRSCRRRDVDKRGGAARTIADVRGWQADHRRVCRCRQATSVRRRAGMLRGGGICARLIDGGSCPRWRCGRRSRRSGRKQVAAAPACTYRHFCLLWEQLLSKPGRYGPRPTHRRGKAAVVPGLEEGLGTGWFPRLLGSVRCSCGWDTRDFSILVSGSILITASTTCWHAIRGSGAVPVFGHAASTGVALAAYLDLTSRKDA